MKFSLQIDPHTINYALIIAHVYKSLEGEERYIWLAQKIPPKKIKDPLFLIKRIEEGLNKIFGQDLWLVKRLTMKISLHSDPNTKGSILSVSHSYTCPVFDQDRTEQRTAHVQIPIAAEKATDVTYVLEKTEAIVEKIIRHVYFKNQV